MDLQSIVQYHEQVLRSMENQLAQLIETQQKAEARMERFDRRLDRAVRLGVLAYRRERRQRQEEDRRLEAQLARSRADWEQRMGVLERNIAKLERNVDRFLKGLSGSDGRAEGRRGRPKK